MRPERIKAVSASRKATQAVQAVQAEDGEGFGPEGRPDPDLSREELLLAAEKYSESRAPAGEAEEERERKSDREQESARDERAEGKDRPRKAGEKDGAKGFAEKKPQAALKRAVRDGFEQSADPIKAAVARLEQAAAATATRGAADAPQAPRPERPPDAMALLHAAQEPGVFFKENSGGEGQSGPEDAELAAAVEEAVRLLSGVAGIDRIGPGRNEQDEPVVVIAAARGFGEASFRAVPSSVHRFPTLVAVPYDLLPLRRAR